MKITDKLAQSIDKLDSVVFRAIKGDLPGHEFHGNQWGDGQGNSGETGELDYISTLKESGFNVVNPSAFDNLHSAAKAIVSSQLASLSKEYPGLVKEFNMIKIKVGGDAPFSFVDEMGGSHLSINGNMLGKDFDKTNRDVLKSQKNGFLAGKGGIAALIHHEIGHVLDLRGYKHPEWNTGAAKSYIRKTPPTAKDLSRYGLTNKHEVFAEAFSSYKTNDSPGKWQRGFNEALSKK